MSKVLRISSDVYQRLESDVKGFESPSDVIGRMADSHDELDVIKRVVMAIISANDFISETGEREKAILLHYSSEVIDRAMKFVIPIFPQYKIDYVVDINALILTIREK